MTPSQLSSDKMLLSFILAPVQSTSSPSPPPTIIPSAISDAPVALLTNVSAGPVGPTSDEYDFAIRPPRHTCACGFTFNRSLHYLYHISSSVSRSHCDAPTYQIYLCETPGCHSGFRRKSDCVKHVASVHTRLRPFKCGKSGCESAFFMAKDLKNHCAAVHLRQRPFDCGDCGQTFGKKEHLTNHVRSIHLRIKPYGCNVCGILLASKHNLMFHTGSRAHLRAVWLERIRLRRRS